MRHGKQFEKTDFNRKMEALGRLKEASDFLLQIWGRLDKDGFVFLATRSAKSGAWREYPISLTKDISKQIIRILKQHSAEKYDIYFCPNPFSEESRKKVFALPTKFVWADIDDADPRNFSPKPNLVWFTSPGRTQGLWIANAVLEPDYAELCSKEMAYTFGADKGGWTETKLLRLPGTVNHKPQYNKPKVSSARTLRKLPNPQDASSELVRSMYRMSARPVSETDSALQWYLDAIGLSKEDILKRYWHKLSPSVRYYCRDRSVVCPDRSKCIWAIISGLHQAGAAWDEIACLAFHNAYYRDKHGTNLEPLIGEIERAKRKLD